MNFTIDQKLCVQCKLCIEVCPTNLIEVNSNNRISFIMDRTSICIGCGQCMAVCSTKAITTNNLTYEKVVFHTTTAHFTHLFFPNAQFQH